MKKNLLLLLGLVLFTSINAQVYFEEKFNSNIPATWQNIDNTTNGGGVWEWVSGGGTGLAVFDSDGYGNDGIAENADLITPMFDCTSAASVYLKIEGLFAEYSTSAGRVYASNNNGTSWTLVKTINTDSEDQYINLTAIAAGNDSVKLKFNYQGSWAYFWVLDAVKVYTPDANDASMLSIDNSIYVDLNGSPISFTGTMQNSGSSNITSFVINYSVDGAPLVSSTITGVNIPFGGTYTYTHPTTWAPTSAGSKSVVVSIGNVNGSADANLADNAATKEFSVFDVAVQRVPLFEVFTSSTCGPCKPGNTNFHNIVDTKPAGDYTSIKYQQDFPGTGDPYTTAESTSRRNYYGVNSIPRMEIDGGWDQNASSFTEALYTDARARPAFMTLKATYNVDTASKTVSIKVDGQSIQAYPAGTYKLHVAVLEKTTTKNVKSNGETEFFNVMKKMVPNESGTAIAAIPNGYVIDEEFTYTFNGNYILPSNGTAANNVNHATAHTVEGFDDLEVVVFVQENQTLDVLQSAKAKIDTDNDKYSDEEETAAGSNPNDALSTPLNVSIKDINTVSVFNVYPNPATDKFNVEVKTVNNETVTVELLSILGETLQTVKTTNMAVFNTSNFAKGVYMVKVVAYNKVVATTPVVVR